MTTRIAVQKTANRLAQTHGLIRKPSAWLIGLSLIAIFALAAPSEAWADTITTFNLTSTSPLYSFGAGSTVTIDTTTGLATGANIIIDNSSNVPLVTFSGTPGVDSLAAYTWTKGADVFMLSDLSTFIGLNGCQACIGSLTYLNLSNPSMTFNSTGVVQLTKAGPEPASILLLGVGLVGLLSLTRLRKQSE